MQKNKRLAKIRVGNFCKIENSYKGIDEGVWIGNYVTVRPGVKIGNGTEIRNYCFLAESCIIGKDVRIFQYSNIGARCKVEDKVYIGVNVILLNDRKLVYLREEFEPSPCVVSMGARVGSGSIILPGVVVGKNAVVGAGSVVTKTVPDGEVWYGNPAKFIKKVPKKEWI